MVHRWVLVRPGQGTARSAIVVYGRRLLPDPHHTFHRPSETGRDRDEVAVARAGSERHDAIGCADANGPVGEGEERDERDEDLPTSDIEEQIDALAMALGKAIVDTPCLEEAADSILAALLPDPLDYADDVTRLLAWVPPAPLTAVSALLPAQPVSVGEGRRFLYRTLREWECEDLIDTACLLASELLTNAVRHACDPLRLGVRCARDEPHTEVFDGSPVLPQARRAGLEEESGRGLALRDELASAWGTLPTQKGKTVWLLLPLHGEGSKNPAADVTLHTSQGGQPPGGQE